MANTIPHGPAFTRLPPELLVMIADWMMYPLTADMQHPQLRALRLSCRQYAYLPWLLQHLFHGLRLVASSAHIELSDISLLVPYVERVVFEPTIYSWTMTHDVFRQIAIWQALQPHLEEHRVSTDEIKTMGVGNFIEGRLNSRDRPLVDDEDLQRKYQSYIARANEERELYESGRLISAWSTTLQKLPEVKAFRIGDSDFEEDDRFSVGLASYKNGPEEGEEVCRRSLAPVNDALAGTVFSALGKASANVVELDIECIQTGNFVWADDGTLDQLDLSKMRKLLFRPVCQEIGERITDDEEERVGQCCGLALDELLKRCTHSIEHLEFMPWVALSPLRFPLDTPRPLPKLESIETAADLRFSAFASFIRDARELREVHFQGNHEVRDSGTWREIWRAIRYHPNRMHVSIDQIPCHSAAEVSLKHYTGNEKDEGLAGNEGDPWTDIDRSLGNYLANKARWNASCREWFEEADDGEEGAVSEESGLESEEDDLESEEDDHQSGDSNLEDE